MLSITTDIDARLIWVFELSYGSSVLRFTDNKTDITLDGNVYYSDILIRANNVNGNTFTGFERYINIQSGGNIASVTKCNLSLSGERAISGAKFFNAFYPSTGKPYLFGASLKIGFSYDNRTTVTSYLFDGYVRDGSYQNTQIDIEVIEKGELLNTEVPKVKVSKAFLTGVPPIQIEAGTQTINTVIEDNKDELVPIVYGSFPLQLTSYSVGGDKDPQYVQRTPLVPMICGRLDKDDQYYYFIASHQCKTLHYIPFKQYLSPTDANNNTLPDFWKYIPETKTYANLYYLADSATTPSHETFNVPSGSGFKFKMVQIPDDVNDNTVLAGGIYGDLVLTPDSRRPEFIDNSVTTYKITGFSYFSWDIKDSEKIPSLGELSSDSHIYMIVVAQSDTTSAINVRIGTRGGGYTVHSIGASTGNATYIVADVSPINPTWDTVLKSEFYIRTDAQPVQNIIRLYEVYFLVTRFPVEGLQKNITFERRDRTIWDGKKAMRSHSFFGIIGGWRSITTYDKITHQYPVQEFDTSSNFAAVDGRMYGSWITGRGFTAYSSLIERPAHILESILRDEVLSEHDITITSETDTSMVLSGVGNDTDDYYNGAEVHIGPYGAIYTVSDYVGSTHTFTFPSIGDHGDYIIISNIKGDDYIDKPSFDTVRTTWKFAKCINQEEQSNSLFAAICFNGHMALVKDYQKYKLVHLDTATAVGTFGAPVKMGGQYQIKVGYTPIDNLYSQIELKYCYDYAQRDYTKTYYCDKSEATSGILSTYKTYCRNVELNYNIRRKITVECDWINDANTAKELFIRLVPLYTRQRMVVTFYGAMQDYIKYQIGDKVKINFSEYIPNSKNNMAVFIINSAAYMTNERLMKFELTELL
jgi:hypothetical protein